MSPNAVAPHEALSVVPATPRSRLRAVRWTEDTLLVVFVIGFGAWSSVAPLESAAIASGVIEVESSRKTVQHLEGGIIGKILVRDGDEVAGGQVLIQLDDTRARTQLQALRIQYWDALAREARLVAERDERSEVKFPAAILTRRDTSLALIVAGQQKIFEARRHVLQSHASVISERIAQVRQEIVGLKAQEEAASKRAGIIRDEYAAIKPLVNKGLQTRPRLLALEREMAEIDGRKRRDHRAHFQGGASHCGVACDDPEAAERSAQRDRAVSPRDTESNFAARGAYRGGGRSAIENASQGARRRHGDRPSGPYARGCDRRRCATYGSRSKSGPSRYSCAD